MGGFACKCCGCTAEDLPDITIAGMTASAPWGRYGSEDTCCWIRTYTQDTVQPETLVGYDTLVLASQQTTSVYDAAYIYHFQSWDEPTPGCFRNRFTPTKIVGGRVTRVLDQFENMYFGVLRQKTDVTILIGKIPIECPGDAGPTERWSLTVLQDGFVRGVKRTTSGTTDAYSWVAASNACGWNPTYPASSTTTNFGNLMDPGFWTVRPFTDPAKVAFRTSNVTVLTTLPTGSYAVEDCLHECDSCVDLSECPLTIVTGAPGTVTPCVPFNVTITYCDGNYVEQSCFSCAPYVSTPCCTTLGKRSGSCSLLTGAPTAVQLTDNDAAVPVAAAFSCAAGESADCFGNISTGLIHSGSTQGLKDWISDIKTCSTSITSSVSIDATLPPITLVFP